MEVNTHTGRTKLGPSSSHGDIKYVLLPIKEQTEIMAKLLSNNENELEELR